MKDPINLSIGLPDFDVPEVAKNAAIEAIRRGDNRYTQTQGIAPLRERLRKDLRPKWAAMSAKCSSPAASAVDCSWRSWPPSIPGDEAIFLDPYFVMYKHLLTMAGGKPVDRGQLSRFSLPCRSR